MVYVFRVGLLEKVTLERKLEDEGATPVYTLRKRLPDSRSALCKGPEAGACLAYLRNSEEVSAWSREEGRGAQSGKVGQMAGAA